MKPITLRNLPPPLARIIQKKAHENGTSLNKTVIALLEEALGIGAKSRVTARYNDLDHLAGRWSKEEASAFQKTLANQRKMDTEIWD